MRAPFCGPCRRATAWGAGRSLLRRRDGSGRRRPGRGRPLRGGHATGGVNAQPEGLQRITDAIAVGELTVPIAATFPTEGIREAVQLQAGRRAHGKIVTAPSRLELHKSTHGAPEDRCHHCHATTDHVTAPPTPDEGHCVRSEAGSGQTVRGAAHLPVYSRPLVRRGRPARHSMSRLSACPGGERENFQQQRGFGMSTRDGPGPPAPNEVLLRSCRPGWL
ncbi:zinc-binding dehydrogenase [Streptomyces sp. NBC_00016]|uniref:zinc-binding dehydrogenase n=1 Tax=Streptomyces sp. NBC_00016 TaxID=2975622 RepID=UPI00386FFD97